MPTPLRPPTPRACVVGAVTIACALAAAGPLAATPEPLRVVPGTATELDCPPDATRATRPAAAAGESPADTAVAAGRAALRIGIWGDSHTATGAFAEGMAAALGLDPADLAPTFLPASWTIRGIAHPLRSVCVSPGWRPALAWQGARQVGAGLVAVSGEQHGSLLGFDFRWPQAEARVTSVRLHLTKQRADRSLVLGISADGGAEALVTLDGAVSEPLRIVPTRPAALLAVRLIAGEATVHGLSPVYAAAQRPRDHLDVFSLPGATAEGWRHAAVTEPAFATSKPVLDLAVLQYGTNDAAAAAQRPEEHAQALREGLRRFRLAYPGARCVLVGPPDRGGGGPGGPHAAVHAQVAAQQQRAAREAGCWFWDWQAAMGGRGSAAAGARQVPPMMQADLTHLTPQAYRAHGHAFGAWLAGPHR